MLRNYLKIALRSLKKDKALSLINILGLSGGMACALLMILFIKDELSFDRFHHDPDRIYRVVKDFVNDDGTALPDATTPPGTAWAMAEEMPDVEAAVRIFPNWGSQYLIKYGDKRFYEEGLYRADSTIFSVFNFPFIYGNPATAFDQLKSIVFTRSAATKYFGSENPMGKTIEIGGMGPHQVTGVMEDVPANSHFRFDFLIPLRTLRGADSDNWGFYNFYTYVKLRENANPASLDARIQAIYKKHESKGTNRFYTQPLTSIHLNSNLRWELAQNSSITYVYIFATVALFLILIAAINYINLVTAKASLRAKEVGVRKVAGAMRESLIYQFLAESVLTVLLSAVVALVLAAMLLPGFNHLTGKSIALLNPDNGLVALGFLGFSLVVGLLAGIYPAFYLSGFKPVLVLKGLGTVGKNTITLRQSLIVVQFVISVVLIIGSLVISSQLDFIQSTELGFSKEHVLVLNNAGATKSKRESLRNDLLQVAGVQKAAGSDGVLTGVNNTSGLRAKGSKVDQLVNYMNVSYDFLDVMGMELVRGRNFSPQFPSDSIDAFILNETAVRMLQIKEPVLGEQIVWAETPDTTIYVKVIGVVKDFHFTSLRNEIKPFAFAFTPQQEGRLVLKLDSKDMKATLAQIDAVWARHNPEKPVDYYFLDERVEKLYKEEQSFRRVFSYFTAISLLIACLGLFGLAAYTAERRTKEIGIRKVLGASVSGIVALLSKDFLKLILIAALISFPLAAFLMHRWLEDFAYRISLPWWAFPASLAGALAIGLLTVSFQAIRAATSNPVKSLRTE